MQKAALQKEKDLEQCRVCPYSIYDSLHIQNGYIEHTAFYKLRLFYKYLLCRVSVHMLSWDVGTIRILQKCICIHNSTGAYLHWQTGTHTIQCVISLKSAH